MDLLGQFVDHRGALDSLSFEALAYLLVAVVLFALGKWINDLLTPYNVNKELGDTDNKALAVSYAGYLGAQGIIIVGILMSPGRGFARDLAATALWSLAGIVLLNLSRVINDKIILRRFDSVKEIIEDKNVGTAAVQLGGYLGSAFIIKAIVMGESRGLVADIAGTVVFYLLAQVCFVVFGLVYQKVTSYDIHGEIERDNAAAGVAFGLSLCAMGLVMSHILTVTNSVIHLGVWFVNSLGLIMLSRFLVDKIILPRHALDREIAEDRNWGIALIEGGSAVMVAFLINASFA
jgi:uncharacterized membrane protein YjfL (UPF0719 family)